MVNNTAKSKLKREGFVVVYSSRGVESIVVGKAQKQECAAGAAVRSQREGILSTQETDRGDRK